MASRPFWPRLPSGQLTSSPRTLLSARHHEEAYLDVDGAAQSVAAPVPTAGDDDLLLAAEAFLSGQATPSTIGGPAGQAALPAEQHSLQAAASAPQGRPAEHEVSIPTAGPPPEQPSTRSASPSRTAPRLSSPTWKQGQPSWRSKITRVP